MVIWTLSMWLRFQTGFDERIGEAEVEEIQDRLLAEVVVDAEDRVFGEEPMQHAVQFPGRGQVAAERLFHDHAGILGAAGLRQPFRDGGEHAGRDGQIVQGPLGAVRATCRSCANVAGSR